MLAYDSKIIYEFAARLYKQANSIIAIYTVVGALIGGIGGYVAGESNSTIALVGAVILGALGFYIGREKAFALKLHAQTALCQVAIEENTRSRGVQGGHLPSAGTHSRSAV